MAANFEMNELDLFRKNAGLTESPVTDLSPEANEQLANDMEKIATDAYRVADSLRNKNKKAFVSSWDEFTYMSKRTMNQINQRYR